MRSNILSTVARLTSTTSMTRPALLAVIAAGAVLAPHPAFALDDSALPSGENVVGGSASFDRATANLLNVNQATDRVVINWDSFNIGANAKTEFFQPSSGSLAVNRVVSEGRDPTKILGTLKANGRVMVLDRNGVLFGTNSVVDVGGIVASTGDVDTAAVMSGANRIVLSNLGSGEILNNGTVNVADGGLAAFVAPTVRNNGIINAKLGKVVLAASAETATIDLYGDGLVELAMSNSATKVLSENTGTINAESGTVMMTTSAAKDVVDTVVNMSGVINASSATMVGGKIILSGGKYGKVKVSGKANASGESAGSVTVKGKEIELTDSSVISADGGDNGNGGRVDVLSDQSAIFRGKISAEGGKFSGNGGDVEVSTGEDLVFTGDVSTQAANGTAGTLTIDPTTMTIHSGLLTWLIGATNYLSDDLLSGLLAANGTVTVQATNTVNVGTTTSGVGIGTGDVDVSSYWFFGWRNTQGNLNLKAATVDFIKNLTVGNGNVSVDATTLNLNSKVYGKDGASTVLLSDSRLNSSSALTQINVQSPSAKIQQAVSFANNGATIAVAAGTYNESVLVDKSVGLYGTDAIVTPNSPGFYITANNVTVDGFGIVGASEGIRVVNANDVTLTDNDISNYTNVGIWASGSNNLDVERNAIHNGTGSSGIRVENGTSAKVNTNNIHDAANDGITLVNADDVQALSNTIRNTYTGIRLTDSGTSGAQIDGNEITDTLYGIWADKVRSLVVTGNTLDGQSTGSTDGKIGLYVLNSDGAQIGAFENRNIVEDYDNGVRLIDSASANIEHNDISKYNNVGIWASGSNSVNVSKNAIHAGYGSSGIRVENSTSADVNENNINSVDNDGITLVNTDDVQAVLNQIKKSYTGIRLTDSGTNDARIDDNDITDTLYGIWADKVGSLVVTDNTLDGQSAGSTDGKIGIYVTDSYNAQIGGYRDGNTVGDYDAGIRIVDSASADVERNEVSKYNNVGIWASGSNNLDVEHNTVHDGTGSSGIRVEDSDHAEVNTNSLYNVNNDGITLVNTDHVQVLSNTIKKSYTGIRLTDSGIYDARIDDNDITNTQYGIWAEGVRGLVITDNNLDGEYRSYGDGEIGIYVKDSYNAQVGGYRDGNKVEGYDTGIRIVDSASTDVEYNTVSKADDYGIWASNSNDVDVKNNDVRNGHGVGIRVYGSDRAEINDNDVHNLDKNGIELVNSDFVTIKDNDINHVDGHGIYVDPSDFTNIYNNSIHHTGWDGIHLDDGYNAWIHGNDVSWTKGDGIDVNNNSHVKITGNTVNHAGDNGVEVSNSSNADIIGNTVRHSGADGIDVDSSYNADISLNYVDASRRNGVNVSDTSYADISGNTVRNSGRNGIDVDNSYGMDIFFNHVEGSRANGIDVSDSSNTDIIGNRVRYSGNDGIHLEGGNDLLVSYNTVTDSGDDGIDVSYVGGFGEQPMLLTASLLPHSTYYNAKIIGNYVTDSSNNGIEASDVSRLLISRNNVSNSGFGHYGETYRGHCYSIGDGINVSVSSGGDYYGSRKTMGSYDNGNVLIDILGNNVTNSSDDGIDVSYVHQDRPIYATKFTPETYDEETYPTPYGNTVGVNVIGNNVFDSGDDGIIVSLLGGDEYPEMMGVYAPSEPNYGTTAISVVIDDNTVDNPVETTEMPSEAKTMIYNDYPSYGRGDGIQVDAHFSSWSNIVTDTTISNNTVSNSGENGVYISGPSHDFVTMLANELIDNPVGARFESGEIDLTGASNTITGGDVGLQFSPYIVGYDSDDTYPTDTMARFTTKSIGTPVYAPMSLVDNTIGTTVFDGQSTYFVELDNGAFFDPGRPTRLNGLNATYNGFRPSSVGGVLTQAQYNFLESMIYHYADDNTLGLFFFGAVPTAPLSQEDIFRLFGAFNPRSPSGGLIVTGLPRINGAISPAIGGGADFLANIAPAAGDEEDQGTTPQDVSAVEPAAGETSDAACWRDATGILGQGTAVSYSFGDEGSKLLDKAASCGTQSF